MLHIWAAFLRSERTSKKFTALFDFDFSIAAYMLPFFTLLLWGTMDTEVPVEQAYELEKIMKDAGVVTYEGCSHYAYLERLEQTIKVLKSFIGG